MLSLLLVLLEQFLLSHPSLFFLKLEILVFDSCIRVIGWLRSQKQILICSVVVIKALSHLNYLDILVANSCVEQLEHLKITLDTHLAELLVIRGNISESSSLLWLLGALELSFWHRLAVKDEAKADNIRLLKKPIQITCKSESAPLNSQVFEIIEHPGVHQNISSKPTRLIDILKRALINL